MKCLVSTQLRMYSIKGYREIIFLAVMIIPITESNGGHVLQRKCKWAISVTVADTELQQTPDCARSWNWRHAETWLLGCNDIKINNLTGPADNNCWGGGRVRWMNCRQLQDDPKVSDNGRREPRVIFVWFVLGFLASLIEYRLADGCSVHQLTHTDTHIAGWTRIPFARSHVLETSETQQI